MKGPPYNTAQGIGLLPSTPPYQFQGVTMRVFPLRANIRRLQIFCNAYLNLAPELYTFRVPLPYVYLSTLYYGRMAIEAANLGWVSQHEVAFTIPLERYRVVDGRATFAGWAFFSPFIYVDDEMSLTTGREVYGWPKIKASLEPDPNLWIAHPRDARPVLSLATRMFPRPYSGRRPRERVFLEVFEDSPAGLTRLPLAAANPLMPVTLLSQAWSNTLPLTQDLMEIALQSSWRGYPPPLDGGGRLLQPLRTACRSLRSLRSTHALETVNLKQFRDAEDPTRACYQAVVLAPMTIGRVNEVGLMGGLRIFRGDLSGGYRIRLYRYSAQPIVESLGLESLRTEGGGTPRHATVEVSEGPTGNTDLVPDSESDGSLSAHRAAVTTLRPVLPFWVNVDLGYGTGEPLCWRAMEQTWQPGPADRHALLGRPHRTRRPPSGDSRTRPTRVGLPPARAGSGRYNTTLAGADQTVTGPFRFANVTLRVLPLLADPDRLRVFCDAYLNHEHARCGYFEPWGRYVYVIATHFGPVTSETNDVGWWARRNVVVTVPVLRRAHRGGPIWSAGMVSPYYFADSDIAVITDREVNGIPALKGSIVSPPDSWMGDSGPLAERQLLRLETSIFPALNIGQSAQKRLLMEIVAGDALVAEDVAGWRTVRDCWGERIIEELKRKTAIAGSCNVELKNATALALEIMANRKPINQIALKQFRDVGQPDLACYQSIVQSGIEIEILDDLREIETPIHLRIHSYPSIPIARKLGLVVKHRSSRKSPIGGRAWQGALVDYFQPVRPFWMRAVLRTANGKDLVWRSHLGRWRQGRTPVPRYFCQPGERIGVGPVLLREVEDENRWQERQHLRGTLLKWRDRDTSVGMTREAARDALDAVEPQMVLEHILSQEWQNWGWTRRCRQQAGETIALKPDFCLRGDSAGPGSEARELFERRRLHDLDGDGRWWFDAESPDGARKGDA